MIKGLTIFAAAMGVTLLALVSAILWLQGLLVGARGRRS